MKKPVVKTIVTVGYDTDDNGIGRIEYVEEGSLAKVMRDIVTRKIEFPSFILKLEEVEEEVEE